MQKFWKFMLLVLVISIVLGILIHFDKIFSSLFPDNQNLRIRQRIGIADTIMDVFITSMVAFITFLINYFILRPLDGHIKISIKRLSTAVILTIAAVVVFSELFFSLKHISSTFVADRFRLLYTFRDVFIIIIVISGVYFIKTLNDRQEIRLENEKLKNENTIRQFESLKSQVSPHILFNSLTALKELISQDSEKAQDYVNHLSSVMRYTLQNNQYKTRSLEDEIRIADSFLFLAKIRFGNNLIINMKVDAGLLSYRLPPMSVQTLIENAIKHNEISKRNPLTILIETTIDKTLKVTNILKEKSTSEPGTGLGLLNLSNHYKLLSGQDICITKDTEKFTVEVPLIIQSNDEGINR